MSDDDPWLRFADLKRLKLITNHVTLKRWIERRLSARTHAWP